jgi:hypothetical protein
MRPISSAATIALDRAVSEIGTQHGGRGLATPANSDQIAAWLAGKKPSDMDSAAVLRASSHGVKLRVKSSGTAVYDDRGNVKDYIMYATGCDIQGTPDAREKALADLRNFMTPAPVRAIEQWLAELSVVIVRKADDEFGDTLRLTAYSSRLARYPADVAKAAILGWKGKYWPSWSELEKVCDAMSSHRRAMIAALEAGPPAPEPTYRAPTQEERDRIQAMVNEMFPDISSEWRAAAVDEALKGDCMREEP